MRLGIPKAPSKVKRYLLTSYNVNDVTERAPRDENGNVKLMIHGAKPEFILHIATSLMLQRCFPGNNKVQTTFTPTLMPDKNTCELRNNVNSTSKKLEISGFYEVFMKFLCSDKNPSKSGRKMIHHEPVHVG